MIISRNLSTARQRFSEVYTETYAQYRPSVIKRNKGEEILLLRSDLQKMLLQKHTIITNVIREDDGSVTITTEPLDLYANADNEDAAINELIQEMKDYANDYLDRASFFLQSPNRRDHFPYVLRISLCQSDQEIRQMLEVKHASEV